MELAKDKNGKPFKAYQVQGYEYGCIVFASCTSDSSCHRRLSRHQSDLGLPTPSDQPADVYGATRDQRYPLKIACSNLSNWVNICLCQVNSCRQPGWSMRLTAIHPSTSRKVPFFPEPYVRPEPKTKGAILGHDRQGRSMQETGLPMALGVETLERVNGIEPSYSAWEAGQDGSTPVTRTHLFA